MASPKKRTSKSKKKIRKNCWKLKALKKVKHAFSQAKTAFYARSNENSINKGVGFGSS
jgi:ribosomal protein L32